MLHFEEGSYSWYSLKLQQEILLICDNIGFCCLGFSICLASPAWSKTVILQGQGRHWWSPRLMAFLLLLLSGAPVITSVVYVYLNLCCNPLAHSHICVNGDKKTSVSIESRSGKMFNWSVVTRKAYKLTGDRSSFYVGHQLSLKVSELGQLKTTEGRSTQHFYKFYIFEMQFLKFRFNFIFLLYQY